MRIRFEVQHPFYQFEARVLKEFFIIVHLHLSQTQIKLVFLIECCLDSAIQYFFVYADLIADNHGL